MGDTEQNIPHTPTSSALAEVPPKTPLTPTFPKASPSNTVPVMAPKHKRTNPAQHLKILQEDPHIVLGSIQERQVTCRCAPLKPVRLGGTKTKYELHNWEVHQRTRPRIQGKQVIRGPAIRASAKTAVSILNFIIIFAHCQSQSFGPLDALFKQKAKVPNHLAEESLKRPQVIGYKKRTATAVGHFLYIPCIITAVQIFYVESISL